MGNGNGDVYRDAAKVLERGMAKGERHERDFNSYERRSCENHRHCVLGALEVAGDTVAYYSAQSLSDFETMALPIGEVIVEQYPERLLVKDKYNLGIPGTKVTPKRITAILAGFNNHDDTTVDDVVAVLEKTAVREDERIFEI
jgi:hypothetical protein